MEKQRNALRAGIFMVISLVLIVFVIIAISGASRFTEAFRTYPVSFALTDDIGGLRPGDDVRIGGLKVGSVSDIRIDSQRPAVIVVIDIPAKYDLRQGADIHMERGLTGFAAINIDSFGSGSELPPNGLLLGQGDALNGLVHQLAALKPDIRDTVLNIKSASVKLNTDLDKLAGTADSFTATGVSARATVQNLRARLPEIIDRYETVVLAADRMLDAVRAFFGPASTDFHQTVLNLSQTTGELRNRLPGLVDRIQTLLGNANVAVERVNSALVSIKSASSNLDSATGSIRSLLTDNRTRLYAIIEGLKSTSDNLKYASVEIRHSPWRLLYQPKPGEVGNLNVYDSVRQFAEGASALDDAAGALRDAVNNPHADPTEVKLLLEHLNDSFDKFQLVQAKLWSSIKG